VGGNYDFPHTMVTAGGPGHSQAQGRVKKCWGASINRKNIYQRSFCTCGDHKVAVLDPNDVDLQLSEASQGKELHNYVIIFGTLIDMVNDNKRRVMNS
jgi:hypothetical protein